MAIILLAIALLAAPRAAMADSPLKQLRVYVDLPGDGTRGGVFAGNLVRRDFGHVFVELTDTVTGQTTGRIGFYPKNGVFPPFQSLDDGEMRRDYRRTYEVWSAFALTDEQYAAAKLFVETSVRLPPRFDLDNYNCADWAIDVLRRAGQDIAVRPDEVAVGSSTNASLESRPLWRGVSPSGLGNALRLKNGHP